MGVTPPYPSRILRMNKVFRDALREALPKPSMNRRNLFQSTLLAAWLLFGGSWTAHAAFSLGIDELEKTNFAALKGKRIGLVTNPSGADSKGRSAIAVLAQNQGNGGFKLVKLFGLEHGIDGKTGAGKEIQQRSRSQDRFARHCSL